MLVFVHITREDAVAQIPPLAQASEPTQITSAKPGASMQKVSSTPQTELPIRPASKAITNATFPSSPFGTTAGPLTMNTSALNRATRSKTAKREAPDSNNLQPTVKDSESSTHSQSMRNTPEDINPQYVWVGVKPWKGSENVPPEEIPLQIIVFAEVDKVTGKIIFKLVDSWRVNGILLGYLEHAKVTNIDARGLQLETWFSKASDKTSLLLQIVKGELEVQELKQASGKSKKGKKPTAIKQGAIIPLQLPTSPAYQLSGRPSGLKNPISAEKIETVVVFEDKTGCNPRFDVNLHVTLAYNESYESFEKHILDGDENEKRVKGGKRWLGIRKEVNKVVQGPWHVVTYVLPQVMDSVMMFSWSRLNDWRAYQWLDKGVSGMFGRQFYVEVHVVKGAAAEVAVEKEEEPPTKKRRTMAKIQQGESAEAATSSEHLGLNDTEDAAPRINAKTTAAKARQERTVQPQVSAYEEMDDFEDAASKQTAKMGRYTPMQATRSAKHFEKQEQEEIEESEDDIPAVPKARLGTLKARVKRKKSAYQLPVLDQADDEELGSIAVEKGSIKMERGDSSETV